MQSRKMATNVNLRRQFQEHGKPLRLITRLFVCSILLQASCAILRTPEELSRSSYVAAVVEYKPNGTPWDSAPQELILKNVNNYVHLIAEASQYNAEIVVFPEYGITTLGVPRDRERARPYLLEVPGLNFNPCDRAPFNNTDPIQVLSCAAKTHGIYVVVNLGEILQCNSTQNKTEECPADGFLQYNTNVVFNRFGTIVAKYHKTHLYFEEQFNSPTIPEHSIFETDFGVTFGQFICYDIIFYAPAVELVAKGVQNVIFTSAWVDELPFLMAPQAQALWASSAKVNVLASGYHQPIGGQLGSGIFSGPVGYLNYTFDPNSGTKLILAEVPKVPSQVNTTLLPNQDILHYSGRKSSSYHFYLKEDLRNYSSVLLNTKVRNSEQICHGNFCCSLKFNVSSPTDIALDKTHNVKSYHLIAFDGIRKVAQETSQFSWQVCALVRCLNSSLASCSFKDDLAEDEEDLLERFTYFELEGSPFDDGVMKPGLNTLDISMDLIPFTLFQFGNVEGGQAYKVSADQRIAQFPIQSVSIVHRTYK